MTIEARSPVVRLSRLLLLVLVAALVGCAGAVEPAAEVPAGPRAAAGGGVINTTAADRAVDGNGDAEGAEGVDDTGGGDAVLYDTDTDDPTTDDTNVAVLYDRDTDDTDRDDAGDTDEIDTGDTDTQTDTDDDGGETTTDSAGTDSAVDDAGGGGDDGVDGVDVSGVRFVVDGFGGVLVEGPCGWTGPACPPAEDVAPIDAGRALRLDDELLDRWGPWVGRVFDMCDDHEALVAVDGEWAFLGHSSIGHDNNRINYSAPIAPWHMEKVHEIRESYSIVCSDAGAAIPDWRCWGDGSGSSKEKLRAYLAEFEESPESSAVTAWAESAGLDCYDAAAQRNRYVYVTRWGPLPPRSTVEAAVEEYLAEVARVGGAPSGKALGYRASIDYPHSIESRVDSVVVLQATVSVTDGVLRGLAQNHSQQLWARNVAVMATDPAGAVGEWRFPLTVQPGEPLPFEIEGWAGTQIPADINFSISADLSPTIDLTRALELHVRPFVDLEIEYFERFDYPEAMGSFPDGEAAFHPPGEDAIGGPLAPGAYLDDYPDGYIEWVDIQIGRSESTAHPWLAEAARQQTIENLTVYAAVREGGVILDVFELTPMVRSTSGEWVEMRTIPTQQPALSRTTVGVVGHTDIYLWAGGVAQDSRPRGDEPQ